MVSMTTTEYSLTVRVIDHVDNEGEPCTQCQMEDATVQCQAYLHQSYAVQQDPGMATTTVLIESCLACLIPALDSAPYLDTDRPIVVEVARSATNRPF